MEYPVMVCIGPFGVLVVLQQKIDFVDYFVPSITIVLEVISI